MDKNITISINRFRSGGGMESYTFDLVKYLTAIQHPVKIYATTFDTQLPLYQHIKAVEINQKRIPKKLRPFFFSPQLQKYRQSNEYLVACNPTDYADVFICGGTHLGYLKGMQKQGGILDKLIIHRNHTNYKTAKSIMAHSHLMQHELTSLYGISPEKIHVVHPPADTERFQPANKEQISRLRKQYGFNEKDTVFLFPSTGHKRKGLDFLADFFEQTNLPVKLAVAGSPLPRPMKNVIELGFCKNMPELYQAADYTIMASQYEPFGLIGVESVLSGTRVVLADNMGCCEVLNNQAGFFFSRNNPQTLAEYITQAVILKQNGKHKINNPLQALNYNPTLSYHINQLCKMLEPA
ncbi:glycosyl transferase family 1 [Neisseria arctica]|uniref:Glycosyl transferase family 1 n=1 Tax=Neisseria arctica TaxID=1470200 RepID=A0A0J0YRH3_9NEIS|nr:glycosyltransferase family 4 protein [Neisseria arctica]KLT72715.1 glycosyl transferase family 1 [Neisseria arctica]UOO87207.1 glycosyltransferase family 4 protein [Neisseria arctica]